MKESFLRWEKDLERAQEAVFLGVSTDKLLDFFDYPVNEQNNILEYLRNENKRGEET